MSENLQSITELGNPKKPHGEAGKEMLSDMNEHHSAVTAWGIGFLELCGKERVLDIGCGGGAALKRMASQITSGHLTGVDYSPLSVEMSRKHNADAISDGKMDITSGSVEALPFDNESFDRIITVESFYFWPDPDKDLREVFRVLAKGGKFLIVADINGDAQLTTEEEANVRKYELFNPTASQLRDMLANAGFSDIAIHKKEGTNWICAEGNKQ